MISTMTSARQRFSRLDITVAVVATVAAIVFIAPEVGSRYGVDAFGVVLFAGLGVVLLWRSNAPLPPLAASIAIVLAHAALFPDAVRCGFALPAALLLAYATGAWLDTRASLAGLALVLGLTVAVCGLDGPEGATLQASLFIGPIAAAVWGIGRIVHSRGRLVTALDARTGELREARDERARLEVASERARLSGELSELVQRRLSELARLADPGARNGNDAETLAEIERESRRTLEEMRTLVGVMRSPDADAPVAPQPTLTHLEALLVSAKGAGASLRVEGSPRAVPAGVELSAYRVVEYLLDAVGDAPGVDVRVRFADDALELTVAGPLRRRSQDAIERARERVRLQGGTLRARTREGRAEAEVSLPVLVAA